MLNLHFLIIQLQTASQRSSDISSAEHGLLSNVFVTSILVPLILTGISTVLEYSSALVKGKASQDRIYRVWIQESNPNSATALPSSSNRSSTTTNPNVASAPKVEPYSPRSIDFLYSRSDFTHIEPLISHQWSDFSSVAINLIVGAFAVDIASLLSPNSNSFLTAFIILGHLTVLGAIFLLLTSNNLTEPSQIKTKNKYVMLAIILGLIAMIIAFLATPVQPTSQQRANRYPSEQKHSMLFEPFK
jgi:hypothetical protein